LEAVRRTGAILVVTICKVQYIKKI